MMTSFIRLSGQQLLTCRAIAGHWCSGYGYKALSFSFRHTLKDSCSSVAPRSTPHIRTLYTTHHLHTSPLTINANVKKDVLLFSYNNKKLYRYVTVFGIIQFVFWLNVASFAHAVGKAYKRNREKTESEVARTGGVKVAQFIGKNSSKAPALCIAMGCMLGAFAWMFPRRSVHQLWLLRGGETVKLITYNHFGLTRDLRLPLHKLNFMQSRKSKGVQLSFKVKKHIGYYMMDKASGKFYNTDLFDFAVGLQRKI